MKSNDPMGDMIVLKVGKPFKSTRTDGHTRAIILRHVKSGDSYKYWDDDSFENHNRWHGVEVDMIAKGLTYLKDDVVTGSVTLEKKKQEELPFREDCKECFELSKGLNEHLNKVHQVRLF